jgi:arylsulfatase A-like enzyme
MTERTERKIIAFEATFPFLAGALLLAFLLLLLEGVFQISKASYLSQLSLYQQFAIFFDLLLLISISTIVLWLFMYQFAALLHKNRKALQALIYCYSFLLALLFFIITFSHLDTSFYSAFGWNIYDLPFFVNLLLLFLIVDASLLLVIKKGKNISDVFLANKIFIVRAAIAVLLLSSLFTVQKVYASWREIADLKKELIVNNNLDNRPNIILFAADSLDCRRLGVYGYMRDTTPNIDSQQNSILFTRAYTNCGNSRGSIMSILTGKSPATTKLTFPPDILHDKDSYQHLPNILANLGYFNVSINDGYYASISKSNLRDGFHLENGNRTGFSIGLNFWKRILIAFSHETYMLKDLYERHANKILYMLVRSPRLYNYAKFTTWGEASEISDRDRIDMLKKIIQETNQPIFAHVHLMTTHGPLFYPPSRKFSVGGRQDEGPEKAAALDKQRRLYYRNKNVLRNNNIDEKTHWNLYDDAVLSVDHYFGEIIQTLRETDKLKDTIIIFLTDHGMGMFSGNIDTIRYPLPLIIYLPGWKESVAIHESVQYLDIAPSILAFLNQPVPEWMEGNVIFGKSMADTRGSDRPLLAVYASDRKTVATIVGGFVPRLRAEKQDVGPPHFGLDLTALIDDEKLYMYSIRNNSGWLYDVSEDPFDSRMIDSPKSMLEYHEALYKKLKTKDIYIVPLLSAN